MSKLEIIKEFNTKCKACRKCGLREGAIQVVPGDGNPDADILFIGEGPGEMEDKLGLPFVGRAGKFLNEMLDSIGLQRKDVYIANMVKCRPPKNRDPLPVEIHACSSWLDEQIEIINPKVIVPLGRFAMNKFIPNAVISKDHGKAYLISKRIYFVSYHPAVALYNGSMRSVLIADIQKLKKIIDGNYKKIKSSDELDIHKDEEKLDESKVNLGDKIDNTKGVDLNNSGEIDNNPNNDDSKSESQIVMKGFK